MRDAHPQEQHFRARTADVFRLAKRDHDLTVARLAALTGIPESTLQTWARGDAAMSAWGMVELLPHLPTHLASLLVEQKGLRLVPVEPDEAAIADAVAEASGLAAEYLEARRDGKITPIESARLKERCRIVAATTAAAALA